MLLHVQLFHQHIEDILLRLLPVHPHNRPLFRWLLRPFKRRFPRFWGNVTAMIGLVEIPIRAFFQRRGGHFIAYADIFIALVVDISILWHMSLLECRLICEANFIIRRLWNWLQNRPLTPSPRIVLLARLGFRPRRRPSVITWFSPFHTVMAHVVFLLL